MAGLEQVSGAARIHQGTRQHGLLRNQAGTSDRLYVLHSKGDVTCALRKGSDCIKASNNQKITSAEFDNHEEAGYILSIYL